ncbi:dihydroxyacetone kinase family protein [Curtobacterium aurantiacum]|uniref:Dihydroxyacetone kinase family protein n=1 Tax=Curtobacterium aurantiacum TaxID=3236919 RepID=A0ABS5VIM2_9MICO|nr:dihydroxyacetone kinase family protein [Curtobacterium flaccumfaciens]MBT1546602.1 dihydroxyacetone kinase family protein [Curtobacterium flaccumfaciens pv. flaccumfaciens]MBT1589346.1 dihydroxyacetone kinase family protein [Curtobacterium flaccumfaciens pv. flaccumfaciens]
MTRLFNDPADFADEMVDGFVAANRSRVRKVHGGVARSTTSPEGTVALVVGGGSGHYPAFGGLVGHGLAAGAAMGNLFASPSAQQITAVAKASEHGGGVLLSYGNYAGDVLNFDAAARALEAQGIEVRTVRVTDDVASAPADQTHERRGIAGDLCVFKVAGAAAERGDDLDAVTAIATRANDRTRSFGVAFSGCSLPGAEEPLFTVPEGRMAIGMGIHGERGIAEADVPTADGLADLLVDKLLTEVPSDLAAAGTSSPRVVPILNGLGSVKYEELFVVFNAVQRKLTEAGIVVVEPEVGELVTSFDMAGVSLTLFWLDDELEQLWAAPADAPAFRKGGAVPQQPVPVEVLEAGVVVPVTPGTVESRASAARVVSAISAVRATIDDHADELGRIDAVAGDGDHGIGMQRGSTAADRAAQDAAARGAGAGSVLAIAGDVWSDKAGGTSGAIWGAALEALGRVIGDESRPTAATVQSAVHAAVEAVLAFGAVPGDKTMVDALVPFDEVLTARVAVGDELVDAWSAASAAAQAAADATADLLPRMGRARTHGEDAVGTPDAGAVSFALITAAVLSTMAVHA